MSDQPFAPDQQEYLKGFLSGVEARRAALGLPLAPVSGATADPNDLQRLAQDRDQARAYASLGHSGFLGEEDRLDWLGSLAQVRATLDVQRLGWRLSARTPSNLSPGLYSSTMTLEIAPGDTRHLAQFLARLRASAHGLFTVSGCTLLPDADGHSVSCTLEWWTWNAR